MERAVFMNELEETGNLDFAQIPAGRFVMGDNAYGHSREHEVKLTKPFMMQKLQVTQWRWQSLMGSNPSYFIGPDRPVDNVSWNDAIEFIGKLNKIPGGAKAYRLPTEAEWEYSARSELPYGWAGTYHESSVLDYAWYRVNSGRETHPVGQKLPNEFGLYDMSGNISEWVADWYEYFTLSHEADPKGPSSGTYRILRGGSCRDSVEECRATYRHINTPDSRRIGYGFRLARDMI